MSQLLKYARAKDDQSFVWRIAAAMMVKAQEIEFWDLQPASRALVDFVLDNPMQAVPAMVNHVSTNPSIAENVTVSNGTVSTEDVPDGDIQYVVGDKWDRVADSLYTSPAAAGSA
ncbi:hypothetical protein [Arthrobacter sp. MP_2.3]|uniref:hypothetical protein n=1 Tax=Arthrobacter sp. MP_2.3 TaxID=3349633 RepID=UPI0038D4C3CE